MSSITDNKPHRVSFRARLIGLAVKIVGALRLSVARGEGGRSGAAGGRSGGGESNEFVPH